MAEISGVCFTPDAPNFDGTRCMIPGLESVGAAGWNPEDNIIESIRCGCITDTYSHLKKYLVTMEAIRGCLQQAQLGQVKGSYCERLMGQAVCDVATNVVYKTLMDKSKRTGADGEDSHPNIFTKALSGLKEGDAVLNDRYEDSFLNNAGLSSDQIFNKVCLASLSGDWSVLSDSILTSIDQNEVKPSLGPALPESRLQGYNPFTGALSIMYTFTYAVVSGGQDINTKYSFICDSSAPGGDFCPQGQVITSEQADSSIKSSSLYVSKGGSVSQTVRVTDAKARYRYNILQLTHTYSLKGETITTTEKFQIFQNGEIMLANCYFTAGIMGAGSGYSCNVLFNDNALVSAYNIDSSRTSLQPAGIGSASATSYYSGNSVYLDLGYSVSTGSTNTQTQFDVAYFASCKGSNGGTSVKKESLSIDLSSPVTYGSALISLFEIPTIGGTTEATTTEYQLVIDDENTIGKINADQIAYLQFTSTDTNGHDLKVKGGTLIDKLQSIQIEQNIVVNKGSEVASTQYIIKEKQFEKEKIYSIVLEGDTTNVGMKLVYHDSTKEVPITLTKRIVTDETQKDFNNLQEGPCTLQVRILPLGKGSEVIAATDFKTYNPLGEDVQTDSSQQSLGFKEFTFTILRTPTTDQTFQLKIFEPYKDESYCIDDTYPFTGV